MLNAHKHRGLKSLASILLLFGAIASSAHSSTTDRPSVSVVGVGQVEVPADLADISLGFRAENKDSSKAMDEVNRRLNYLLKQLGDHGIDDDDVVAGSIRIHPRYDYRNDQELFRGYSVDRSVSITVKDLGNLPNVLSTAVDSKLSNINGVEYRSGNHERLLEQAREAAIANSKQKANALAVGFNATLGPVFSVVYSGGESSIRSGVQLEYAMTSKSRSGQSAGRYIPGKITVTERVEVVFELLPK
jgi:uncharacterized protein YggE